MPLSLSVLIPVRNRQGDLDRVLRQAVDVLPDLAPFNVMVVDDASTDATYEVAHDWSRRYPQVRVIRQTEAQGVYAAIRAGLVHVTGDVVMLARPERPFDSGAISRLWWHMPGHEIVVARPIDAATSAWQTTTSSGRPQAMDVQLYRRPLLKLWSEAGQNEEPLTYLVLKGYVPQMIDVPAVGRTLLPYGKRLDARTLPAEPKRPNYLARLRELAWGE